MNLIDKDKVKEWLEAKKKREGWCAVGADVADVYYARGVRFTCDTCKGFLDTLEVKEVDLEKEFANYAKNISVRDVQIFTFTHLYNCAKYFFELGLKTQKGE